MRKYLICLVLALFLGVTDLMSNQFSGGFRYVFVPEKQAKVIKQHLLAIDQNGWGKAEPGDLHHAHLALKAEVSPKSEQVSVKKLFDSSVGVLYHSDEQTVRWKGEDGELAHDKRRPRSLFGYWDGRVIPASTLFDNPETTAHYACCGSIHLAELSVERPKEFAPWNWYRVSAPDKKPCEVSLYIDIYYSTQRLPSIELNGRSYTLTMDCRRSP